MLASITGQRMLFNYFRIGGVNGDINHEFMSRLGDWMSRATEQHDANTQLLNENEIFVRRMRDIGRLDSEHGAPDGRHRARTCGPPGIPYDIRRAHPYSVYPELEFDVPTRGHGPQGGDALDRYLLRVEEVKQSLRIIDQCLHNMPDGPVMAKLPRLLRPRPGRAWAGIEGPRGLYGTYAISDGTDQPFRMKIHDPSFVHLQLVGLLMRDNLIADTMAVMAILDPDHGRRRQVSASGRPMRALPAPVLAHAPRSALAPRPHGRLRLGAPLRAHAPTHRRHRMTAMNRAFSNLTLAGKILLPLLFLVLVVGPIVTVLLGVFIGPWLLPTCCRQHRHRPVRGRRHGDPAVQHPGRVHHHLHGDEGHRADEPSGRAGPGRAVRLPPVGGARAQGPHEGGLHPDGRRQHRVHLGAGRRVPDRGDDVPRHPVRAGARRARTSTSACCTCSRSAA